MITIRCISNIVVIIITLFLIEQVIPISLSVYSNIHLPRSKIEEFFLALVVIIIIIIRINGVFLFRAAFIIIIICFVVGIIVVIIIGIEGFEVLEVVIWL